MREIIYHPKDLYVNRLDFLWSTLRCGKFIHLSLALFGGGILFLYLFVAKEVFWKSITFFGLALLGMFLLFVFAVSIKILGGWDLRLALTEKGLQVYKEVVRTFDYKGLRTYRVFDVLFIRYKTSFGFSYFLINCEDRKELIEYLNEKLEKAR